MSDLYDSILQHMLITEIISMWPQASRDESTPHDLAEMVEKVYGHVKATAPYVKSDDRARLYVEAIRAVKEGR